MLAVLFSFLGDLKGIHSLAHLGGWQTPVLGAVALRSLFPCWLSAKGHFQVLGAICLSRLYLFLLSSKMARVLKTLFHVESHLSPLPLLYLMDSLSASSPTFFFFFFFLRLYNAVMVSAVHQHELVIIIYIYPLPLETPPPQFHPSRSSQSTRLGSLCCTAASH